MASPSLDGARIVAFESRMAEETARLIQKFDGTPQPAPSMQEVPLSDHAEVFTFGEKLYDGEVGVLICNTGVGTRMLLETLETKYERDDLLEALSSIQIVARGPKPTRELRKNDLPVTLKVPEPNTWREILQVLDDNADEVPVEGRVVAVQEYGQSNEQLNEGLTERGADLLPVPIYRWALPDDLEPLQQGLQVIIDGEADVALFTSRTQADHVMKLAARERLENALRKGFARTLVASIGPVCTKGLESHDIAVDFEPDRPKLGVFLRELSEEMARRKSMT